MLDGKDAGHLLAALIDGMVEEPPWATFLDRLRARLGADYASLVFRPFATGPERNRVIHLYSGRPSPPLVSRLYHDSLHAIDPMPYQEMREGQVYALAQLLDLHDPSHRAYFDDFLVPSGMTHLHMLRVTEAQGVSAWLTVSRQDEAFGPDIDGLLADLAAFLRSALHSYVALEGARLSASMANEAIRRMNFGWIALDAGGRVIETDSHAAGMLAASNLVLQDRKGRLTARTSELAQEIDGALADMLDDANARPRAIVLSREPWFDLLLVASPQRMTPTGPAPAIVAYVHADNWSSADRCEQLGELFDLTPSEARLALALSRGMSIAEAASETGLTVESARTYSKRIYAKTGARGRADLVRFIHRSVLSIA